VAFVPLYDVLMSSRSDTIRTAAVDVMNKIATGIVEELRAVDYATYYSAASAPGALPCDIPVNDAWCPISLSQIDEYKTEDPPRYIDIEPEINCTLGYDPTDPDGVANPDRNYVIIDVKMKWKERRNGKLFDREIRYAVVKGNPHPFPD
jgi:hypothetical protein